jgi:hypothetical protein
MLVKVLLDLRNNYARGRKDRHNPSLRKVQIVSEIINQLYPEPPEDMLQETFTILAMCRFTSASQMNSYIS